MNEPGQTIRRATAYLRRRETLRIAAPVAGVIIVAGILLGVFLPGGPESDGPTGQTVDIADRETEASADGAPPADEAPADTTDAADAGGDTAVTAEPGPDAAPAAATTETVEAAGTTETAEGTETAGTTGTTEGAGSAGSTETAEGAGSAGTTETAEGTGSAATTDTAEGTGSAGSTDTAGTTETAGSASASSSADAAVGGADAAAQQDAAAPTAEDDGAPAATAEAGPDEESDSSAGADEAAVARGGDAADTAVSGDAAGDVPAEGVDSASGQEMAAASADDTEAASGQEMATASTGDDAESAAAATDDGVDGSDATAAAHAAGGGEGADGSEASAGAAAATVGTDAAETAPSSQATSAGTGTQGADETITEAPAVPDETVDTAPQGAAGEGPGEGPSTATEPSDAGGDGGQTASGEEPGDAVTPPSFDTVRILPNGSAMIAGRAEPGAEVTIQSGSTVIGSVTADGRGEWVLQTDEPIPPGDHELSAVETLPDGRQMESEHVLVLSVPDLAAGEKAGDVQVVLVPRDGEEPGDAVTPPSFGTVRILPNGSAMIAGRAEPGAEVTIQSGSTVIGSVTADPRGEWVLQTDEPIPPGDHQLSAVETLPDGRQMESEHVLVLSVPDLAAGEKAGDVQVVLVPRDGEEPGDAVTPPSFDTVRILPNGSAMIAGRAEPGAEVTIQSGSTVIGSVTADPRGEWVLQTDEPIPPGDHQLSAVETLPDGRQMESEHVLVLSVPDLAAGEKAGDVQVVLVPRDGEERGDAVTPPSFGTVRVKPDGSAVFAGRAEPGAEVTIQSGSAVIGSVTADGRGEWVLVPDEPIPPGDHVFSAVETLPDGRQVESEHLVVLSVPDIDAGEDPGSAFAALVPRDGEGASKVLQKPAPAPAVEEAPQEEPVDMARLGETSQDMAQPDAAQPDAAQPDAAQPDAVQPDAARPDDTPSGEADMEDAGADAAGSDESGAGTAPAAAGDASSDASSERTETSVGTSAEAGEVASAAPPEGVTDGSLSVDTVDYDDKGEMTLRGKAEPETDVAVYVDEKHVGTVESDEQGEWVVDPEEEVEPGSHTLRVDQVDPAGVVLARIETPLVRARPELLTLGDAIVVVQPGNSLWRIARRTLGGGIHFTEIFEANRSQIRNPALIYPGQIFALPSRDGG